MIDVSQFNGSIAWGKVPKGERVLVRTSYGETGLDSHGAANLAGAEAAGGLVVGAYHFLEDGDPTREVAHFLSTFHPKPGGLRGMIDVEPSQYSHPTLERVVGAVAAYRAGAGHDPIIYGTHDVLAALHLPASVASCPLMLAGYGPNDGRRHDPGPPPAPWKAIAAHQYTSVGTIPGVSGHVDLSHVYDEAALTVPAPRPPASWTILYVDKGGQPARVVTRTPLLWLHAHPGAKYRGSVTITPHKR